MFKLDTTVFFDGAESEAAILLGALQNISTITPPVTIFDIRSQLETGQFQAFTDAGYNQFLQRVYDLPLVDSELDAAERSILNTIREELDPTPIYSVCGGAFVPDEPDFVITFNERVGTATFEREIRGVAETEVPCSCEYIDVAITALGSSTSIPTDFVFNKLGAIEGKLTFSYLWLDFTTDPTGESFNFDFDFKTDVGVSLGIISKTITL